MLLTAPCHSLPSYSLSERTVGADNPLLSPPQSTTLMLKRQLGPVSRLRTRASRANAPLGPPEPHPVVREDTCAQYKLGKLLNKPDLIAAS